MNYRVSTHIRGTRLNLAKDLEFTLGDDRLRICASATQPTEPKKAEYLIGIAEANVLGSSAEMLTLVDNVGYDRAQVSPERYKELLTFCMELNARLISQIERVVSALRWRCGVSDGPADALSETTYEYSIDGSQWRSITFIPSYRITVSGRARNNLTEDEINKGVSDLLARNKPEPLAYQLLREAYELRKTHPRSALVIGMSAMEVGLKHLVADLVPDAAWLAIEVPSPPLDKMLREYLPKLPVRSKLWKHDPLIPRKMIEVITEGTKLRNKLAHSGKFLPDEDTLQALLFTINDLLLLFDVYSGETWAIDHVGISSRTEISNAITKQLKKN
jgi:hypothetical protein